jgi:NarL family two-component system response regulator LiaR
MRLMLAEDFELLREDWLELLNSQPDMEVVGTAASGEEIIKLADEVPCDIILMDIEMETIDAGIRATEKIKTDHPEIKVIFLTAHEDDRMVTTAMGSGAVDYIVKGEPEEQLLQHIRAAYEGHPFLESKIQEKVRNEYVRLRRSEKSLLFFIYNVTKLTPAEYDLVKHLLMGRHVREIAKIRCVEIVTVKTQIKSLLKKFGCSRSSELVQMIKDLNITHLFINEKS